MVHDLLAGFVPGDWVRDLHLSTLEPWPEGHASDDFGQHRRDRMWRVRLRDHWLCVSVLLEFQPTMDWTMAVRILVNNALLYRNLLRDEPHDPLPPVLPLVVYHGVERWSAPMDVAGLAVPPGEHLAPYQPSQRYFVLDVAGHSDPLPEGGNLVATLIRLERSRDPSEDPVVMRTMFRALARRVPGSEGLMRLFRETMEPGLFPMPVRNSGCRR